jgi:hypothetical protein
MMKLAHQPADLHDTADQASTGAIDMIAPIGRFASGAISHNSPARWRARHDRSDPPSACRIRAAINDSMPGAAAQPHWRETRANSRTG